jgi:DNA primase
MPNAVAVSGTALTGEQLALIQRYTTTVRLFFDMDGAGQTAARKSAELALSRGFNVFVVARPPGKVAADAARDDIESLRKAVNAPVPALQYFLDVLLQKFDRRMPEGKREIVKDYLLLLQCVQYDIDRMFWLKRLSGTLDIDEKVLIDMLKKTQGPAIAGARANDRLAPSGSQTQSSSIAFIRQSEILRRSIISLMLLEFPLSRSIYESLQQDVVDFLQQDAIAPRVFDVINRENASFESLIAELQDEGMKNMIIGLYFEAEKLLSGSDISDEDVRRIHIHTMILGKADILRIELRKEKMAKITKEIDEANSSGDKHRALSLIKEFDSLKNAS